MKLFLGDVTDRECIIVKHVTGREGRWLSGALLPVNEFGLRISVHNIGDVAIRKSGYDPVRKIARNRILRL